MSSIRHPTPDHRDRRSQGIRLMPALLAACGLLACSAQASTCRVTTSGAPAADGSDWGAQAKTLTSALADANCTEIWLAAGVYRPVEPASPPTVTLAEREASFRIDRALSIYGGFAGSETAREQRDPASHLSVLSGDIGGDDVVNGDGITESAADIVGGNSFHVVWIDGGTASGPITTTTRLDGLVVTAGLADGTDPWSAGGRGGGLYCDGEGGECSPALVDLVFIGNRAHYSGGALYHRGVDGISSPVLDRVDFVANTAGQVGGAIHNHAQDGASSPQLGDVEFTGNHADASGGAIYSLGVYGTSSPALSGATFDANSATEEGGAMTSHGLAGTSAPQITNASFHANTANDGGAMFNHARSGGVASPLLRNLTFNANTAGNNGGAILNEGLSEGASAPTLVNVILWGNSAANLGAEVWSESATPTIRDSIVAGACPAGADCSGGGIIDADPLLGPLQDNGGFTRTQLIDAAGAALDAGSDADCPGVDQRGVARPFGPGCDVGAVERAFRVFANGFEAP